MARRKGKNEIEAATVGIAILVLVAIALAVRFITAIGAGVLIVGILLIVVFAAFRYHVAQKRAARLAALRAKYGDEALIQRIARGQYWQGQTSYPCAKGSDGEECASIVASESAKLRRALNATTIK